MVFGQSFALVLTTSYWMDSWTYTTTLSFQLNLGRNIGGKHLYKCNIVSSFAFGIIFSDRHTTGNLLLPKVSKNSSILLISNERTKKDVKNFFIAFSTGFNVFAKIFLQFNCVIKWGCLVSRDHFRNFPNF